MLPTVPIRNETEHSHQMTLKKKNMSQKMCKTKLSIAIRKIKKKIPFD